MSLKVPTPPKQASTEELKKIFEKYATVEKDGEKYLTYKNFVCDYLKLVDQETNSETIDLIAKIADTTKDRLISLVEFQAFESLLCAPDAISQLSFKLFDVDKTGKVSYGNFYKVLSSTTVHQQVNFNFESTFVKQYFGTDHSHELSYEEFVQLLQSLPTEHARQAFISCDPEGSGSIPAVEFIKLMSKIREFRMSSYVKDHLLSVAGGSVGQQISFPQFKAFNQLLGNLDIMEKIVHEAVKSNPNNTATKDKVTRVSQQYAQVTPLQINMLFDLCNLERREGSIAVSDFNKLLYRDPIVLPAPKKEVTKSREDISIWMKLLEPVYRFALGGVGGAAGATAVYPIDLVKTRMQNQRGSLAGEIMYRNSFHCFAKVIRNEGFFGLYRGLLPQLMGVSPEKAIKLTANDTMRDLLTTKDGKLAVWKECIAGGCGGACQVLFTNPLEIVKIRLQVAGEMAEGTRTGAVGVIKELGFKGLYKGASACFLRDIPFSAIYFTVYAHMKIFLADEDGFNGTGSLFASAMIAGVPAAGLLTPADVIKTRLQVKARSGQQTYDGLIDCAKKLYRYEGGTAFWKGAGVNHLAGNVVMLSCYHNETLT
ncbi:electrogenic aspartate/glutamate antiporter SLC25A12, mitochondrial-like isoform X2 [Dysidea avara]|uniref:electrogenic aspartate/glutamate antiporter SLC25A12, mitochondrial-like isoform X2 n=1 Tax=Dysidea avara TaxID=196820 RepID=UPI00331E8E87